PLSTRSKRQELETRPGPGKREYQFVEAAAVSFLAPCLGVRRLTHHFPLLKHHLHEGNSAAVDVVGIFRPEAENQIPAQVVIVEDIAWESLAQNELGGVLRIRVRKTRS